MKTVFLLLILALAAGPLTSAWVMCIGQAPDVGSRAPRDCSDSLASEAPPIFNDGGGWVPIPPNPPPPPHP